jgi:hypothetical protein
MQQLFGIQTGIGDLKYTEATEACATRNQAMLNTRDIIDNYNRGNQAILDKLCQLELDGVKNQLAQAERDNADLRSDLLYARGQADRVLLADQVVDRTYDRLKNCPVGSYNVCNPTTPVNPGCGCPNNGNGFGYYN